MAKSPKRTELTKDDRDALLLMAGAVLSGAQDYRTIIKTSSSSKMKLDMARLSRTRRIFKKVLNQDNKYVSEDVFGPNDQEMELNDLTWAAIEWAWKDLLSEFGWENTFSESERSKKCIRISTENFLAVHLLPTVLASYSKGDIDFEVRESPSLYAAIDDHVRHDTDLVLHTVRKSKLRSKPTMPKLEGLICENVSDETGFRLRDTAWFPTAEYRLIAERFAEANVTANDLSRWPVVLVGYPDAVKKLLGPRVSKPRIVVDSNEAMRQLVKKGFIGVGHNWPSLPKTVAIPRPFEWNRPDIDLCLCYRAPKNARGLRDKFIRALKSCLRSEANHLDGDKTQRSHKGNGVLVPS